MKAVRFATLMVVTGVFTGLVQADQPSQLLLAAVSEGFDAAKVFQQNCYACHGTGAAHAPVIGDTIEWEIRQEKGMEGLIANAINGLNGIMPPRGLCTSCTDDDLRALVQYILDNSK